tara:strand:+ start:231 stop:428 length:198 start_codon:yes stop_codon:yes gene_type:complete
MIRSIINTWTARCRLQQGNEMTRVELILAITEHLNGDADVLVAGWEDSTTEELLELFDILIGDAE